VEQAAGNKIAGACVGGESETGTKHGVGAGVGIGIGVDDSPTDEGTTRGADGDVMVEIEEDKEILRLHLRPLYPRDWVYSGEGPWEGWHQSGQSNRATMQCIC